MVLPAVAIGAEALLLFGGGGQDVFLGCLNCSRHDDSSVCNQYGEFGSRYRDKSSELIKRGLLTSVKAGDANAAVIPGVGEAAIFMSDDPSRAKTTAYVKGILLQVNLECSDARAMMDQVIALLKSAAVRL